MSNLNYFPVVNTGVSLHVFKTHCLIKDSRGKEVLEISSELFHLLNKFKGENCLRVILNNWLMALSKTANYTEIIRKDLLQFDQLINLKVVEFWTEYGVREINIIQEDHALEIELLK